MWLVGPESPSDASDSSVAGSGYSSGAVASRRNQALRGAIQWKVTGTRCSCCHKKMGLMWYQSAPEQLGQRTSVTPF